MNNNDFGVLEDQAYGPSWTATHPAGGEFWVRPARFDEIDDLHGLIESEISSDVGPVEAMRAVFLKNPISFWRIERREPTENVVVPIGMYGFLPLNAEGAKALRMDALDRRSPQLAFIASVGEKPACLYVWAMVARRIGPLTFPLIKRALGPLCADVPVYAIPATRGGTKAVTDRGFVPASGGTHQEGSLAMLRANPVENQEPASQPSLEVVVAANADHLQMSAYIRGATFGAEQHCPYSEEFDGNDFCAMHLLGFVDGEPAATLRIRFFATFAKLERLAVVERYRRTAIKNLVMDRAIEICQRKGYTKLYGQSQERLVGFYARFGFRPMQKNRRLVFSDHAYVEIERELPADINAITLDGDPYAIIRPEGRWDTAGVLERSAVRVPTNPQRDRAVAERA